MAVPTTVDWATFAAAEPTLAAFGRSLLERSTSGNALLVTIRGDALPRIHPITVLLVGDRLVTFLFASPKVDDLVADGRYALQAQQDPTVPHEFGVRGIARRIDYPAFRDAAVAVWPFDPEGYILFEFTIAHALAGERATADDWPPVYSSWRAQR